MPRQPVPTRRTRHADSSNPAQHIILVLDTTIRLLVVPAGCTPAASTPRLDPVPDPTPLPGIARCPRRSGRDPPGIQTKEADPTFPSPALDLATNIERLPIRVAVASRRGQHLVDIRRHARQTHGFQEEKRTAPRAGAGSGRRAISLHDNRRGSRRDDRRRTEAPCWQIGGDARNGTGGLGVLAETCRRKDRRSGGIRGGDREPGQTCTESPKVTNVMMKTQES